MELTAIMLILIGFRGHNCKCPGENPEPACPQCSVKESIRKPLRLHNPLKSQGNNLTTSTMNIQRFLCMKKRVCYWVCKGGFWFYLPRVPRIPLHGSKVPLHIWRSDN